MRPNTVESIVDRSRNYLGDSKSKEPAKEQNEQTFTPRIQIRAILIRCPQHIIPDNSARGGGSKSNDDKVISVLRTDDIMRFSGFDKDELLMHSEVKNCKRKMIITMMINNNGRTVTEEEFVVVDHVYDPDLHKRSRLLNPLVFKIKQDAVLQLYGMRYLQSVNAMAREEVLNKGMNNFTGCDTTSSQPTCGMVYHNNRVVPFSEGFCCSCDSYVNLQRQPGLSIVRQQKMFTNRKESNFDDEKSLDDADKYFHEQSKRDVDEQKEMLLQKNRGVENRDNLFKSSNNLDVLRSKYMASDFDFAKNGFYTPQIVRKNRLSDNFNRFSNSEEVSSWEHKGKLYDLGDKGNRIFWNNDNIEQIPNSSEEEEIGDGEKKKRRSVDSEGNQSLNSNEKEMVDKDGGKKKEQDVKSEPKRGLDKNGKEMIDKDSRIEERGAVEGESKAKLESDKKGIIDKDGGKKAEKRQVESDIRQRLNSEGKEIFDEHNGMKERRDIESDSKQRLDVNSDDKTNEIKELQGVDGQFEVSLTDNSEGIIDENGVMKEHRDIEGERHVQNILNSEEKGIFDEGSEIKKRRDLDGSQLEVNDNVEGMVMVDGDGKMEESFNVEALDSSSGVEKEISDEGFENIRERSVHDELDGLIRNSMKVTDEKPFLLKPKDWTSLKAWKLKLKGLKPNSPQFQNSYQPAHRYAKVLEENHPVLENAKGFQMSDYRPRWNPNAKVSFRKPTPWEIIPKKCATDKRNKSILRVLTKLNEERCHPDPFSDEDSKVFDSLMRNIERKLVRNSRNNVNETNTSSLHDDSTKNMNKNNCEEAWSELQTLLLEQAIEEKLCLQDTARNKTTNESNIVYNKEDKKIIDRLKRQVNRWVDDNYETDLSNIYNNSSSKYKNGDNVLQPLKGGEYLYFINSAQNQESPNALGPYSYGNIDENGVVGGRNPQNFVFDNSHKFLGMGDLEFLSENDANASSLYEIGKQNRNVLGLLPGDDKVNYEIGKNLVNDLDFQPKINDQNKYWKNAVDENIALKYPELPLEEKVDGRSYHTGLKVNDYHMMNNIEKESSGATEFHLNPPLHFHSDSGPVFIDETKYGPLLDTRPLKLSQSTSNSYPLMPNDLSLINPQDFDKIKSDAQSRFSVKPNTPERSHLEIFDNSLQDQKLLSVPRSEINEENHDKLEKDLVENAKNVNDNQQSMIDFSGDHWNLKDNIGLQPHAIIDERNSFFIDNNSNKNSLSIDDNSNSNLNKLDDSSNFNFGSDVNRNAKNYADFSNRLNFEGPRVNRGSNVYNIEDENSYKVPMMFDDMSFTNNSSSLSRNDNNNLSHKSYHIYKQEMESPYIINTSHAKHNKPNFQVLKSNGEDIDKRSHYLEVATEFGNPSLLNTSDVQYLMQNAMNSENSTLSILNHAKKSGIENTTPSIIQESLISNGSKPGPILISGNVGNIYGQKGKLIFIPDDNEEQVTTTKQLDYQRNYLGAYNSLNSKTYPPRTELNASHNDMTNSETCTIGKPGYGMSNLGRNNVVNSKLFPSFLKNWSGNPDGGYLPTGLLKDGSVFNSHNTQMNLVQRNNKLDYNLNSNTNVDNLNKPLNNEGKFDDHFDSPSKIRKNTLDNYDFKDGENRIDGEEKIEKRDTEQFEFRSKKCAKKVRRQVSSNGNQIRGGQNCIDRYVPSGANPITYHESAHCLRFSDLWYSLYTLKKPNLDHSLHLQLYEKANFPHSTHWEELTRGITTDLGTGNRHIEDGISTLSFTYIPLTDLMRGDFCLDEHRATLLVPEALPPDLAAKYPQLSGSPNEYLLVQSDDITLEGDECNKVGTSFEGFATQPDRCAQPRGTCLQNQPIDMWTHDIMARDEGKPGKFFLENFAVVAEQPLLVNHSSQEQSLALEYYRQFSTIIEIEVKSDLNAIVRTGESGQLSEVYVDSTCHSNTKITVIVTNQGLASSAYYPKLSNCPVELPEVWTHNVGPLIMIAPQHRHVFQMTMYGELPVDRFHCSVELLNDKKELVATRRVRIQKHDRCVCVWHCLCACTASTEGLSCEVMSLSHYHAAGFQGSLPVINLHPETRSERLFKILMPLAILVAFSLLIGCIKAIIGLCFAIVGAYGQWAVCKSNSRNLASYKEDDLKDFSVEYDVQAFAVHPVSHTRNIKLFNKLTEFFINIFFVFLLIWEFILFVLCCGCNSEEDSSEDKSSDDESDESSDSSLENNNDLEDESVVNTVLEERRRCEEDVKGYNIEQSNQCLIFVGKPGDKLNVS